MTLRSLSIAFFSICVASTVTTSFRTSTLIGRKVRVPSLSIIRPTTTGAAYGKGADIWPENNEGAILISSSFPNGIISDNTIQNEDDSVSQQQISDSDDSDGPDTGIKRILRRAAASKKRKLRNKSDLISSSDKLPIIVGSSLVCRGLIRPMDVALIACWTTYFIILNMTAKSARNSTGTPIMPALPPQEHVPTLISNPLGTLLARSVSYRRWLNAGAIVALFFPIALVMVYIVHGNIDAARVVARPLFVLCCQIITETVSKRNLVPLPLRILIPIIYNASMLMYLWPWITASSSILGKFGLGVGIMNIIYWAFNLFVFLIPIASVRFMRAHFFGVEAEEVTIRIGLEESAGLIPII